jgi:hypothetical protein
MQSDKKSSNTPSVEETTAAITAEQEREEAAESLPQSDKSATFESSNHSSSSENMERSQDISNDRSEDQGNQPARSGQDDHAQKILNNLQRGRESRIQNHSLILDDLKELGMFGELSEDHVTMPFEDVHRLVTTMKMANVILNERVQARRQAKLDDIKTQLDAKHCSNMQALLLELDKAKFELTQNHSFQSMGDFDGIACTLEGSVLFETLLISRAMNWLACLSFDPNLEVRRETLLVFSELRACERPTRHRKRFMSFIFIFTTMTRSFLKREFVVLRLTSGSD